MVKIVFSVKDTGIPMIGPGGAIEQVREVLEGKQFTPCLSANGEVTVEGPELTEVDGEKINKILDIPVTVVKANEAGVFFGWPPPPKE